MRRKEFFLLVCLGFGWGCSQTPPMPPSAPPSTVSQQPPAGSEAPAKAASSEAASPDAKKSTMAAADGATTDAARMTAMAGAGKRLGEMLKADALKTDAYEPGEAAVDDTATTKPAADGSDTSERFLLFTPGGPLVVELEMTIDGRPFRSVREELVEGLLSMADRDHDGRATWAEVMSAPRGPFARLLNLSSAMQDRRQFLKQHDTNQNGLVDRDEIRRFVARVNQAGAAFTLDGSVANRHGNVRNSPIRLLLDTDRDDALSAAELAVAVERLRTRDANDDDILLRSELDDTPNAGTDGMGAMYEATRSPPAAARLGPHAHWDGTGYAFAELYLTDGEIRPERFSLVPGMPAVLDENGDGWLSDVELKRLEQIEPHIRLAVRFGQTGEQQHGLSVVSIAAALGLAGEAVHQTPDGVVISFPEFRLSFRSRDLAPTADFAPSAEAQLAALDADKNGYLELKEVKEKGPAQAGDFEAWDANGDGKVYAAEIAAYNQRQQAPQLSAVHATAYDEEDALFPLLDTDQDGRLTQRELHRAAERLSQFDVNHDEQLTLDEIPGAMAIVLSRGTQNARPGLTIDYAPAADSTVPGPAWFRRMDANRDQEISRNEFPGSREKFSLLDANGDGFIDATEAEQGEVRSEE